MTSPSLSIVQPLAEERFQTAQVAPIVGAHFVHDLYTAGLAPLLPVFIEKMSLSLTQAGSLTVALQIPAIINPLFGYLADKMNLRYFIALAPAVTATLIGFMGFAPSYFALLVMLFVAGISVAAYHAPAPAMIARYSGKQVGLGMSLFMAAGELSYTVGPLLAVWFVSRWTLEGYWRLAVLGWATTLILLWRLRGNEPRLAKPGRLTAILPRVARLFIPLALIGLFRYPLLESISTYLPTYMNQRGMNLIQSGLMFSLVQLAGVIGVLLSGPVSDRLGRRSVLFVTSLISSALMLVFLRSSGWLLFVELFMIGLMVLSTTPVMLAMVQEHFPNNRAAANGVYMLIVFLMRPVGTLIVGQLGDQIGLSAAFYWGALISLLALPAVLALPKQ